MRSSAQCAAQNNPAPNVAIGMSHRYFSPSTVTGTSASAQASGGSAACICRRTTPAANARTAQVI